jgi:ribosomal protein S18 acetylase RimI-like enzyme
VQSREIRTAEAGELEVKNMAVDPAAQGRGLGRALLDAVADLARAEARSMLVTLV